MLTLDTFLGENLSVNKMVTSAGYQPYTLDVMNQMSAIKLFTVMSTFAGAGGSSVGYKLAGGQVLVANEFVSHAYTSYLLNHPTTKMFTGDIKDLTADDFLIAGNMGPGELDIFDGSPPCTNFSMSGKRAKSWDQTTTYHGYKQVQIERLTEHMIRLAGTIKPKIMVIENVKALTSGRAHDYLSAFMAAINRAGYLCTYKVLNASYYGVPQNRERTFLISIRKDIADKLGIEELQLSHTVYPKPSTYQTTLYDGLKGINNDPDNERLRQVELQKLAKGNPVVVAVLKAIKHNPPKQMQFCKFLTNVAKENQHVPELARFHDRASYFNYFRCSWNQPAPTITGRCHSYYLPDEDRSFTKPELMRIMSLPDDYQFAPGTELNIEERIGLMVAPYMMKAIADHLYNTILLPLRTQ